MLNGMRVRRSHWEPCFNIGFWPKCDKANIRRIEGDSVYGDYAVTWDDLNARNWEIYGGAA